MNNITKFFLWSILFATSVSSLISNYINLEQGKQIVALQLKVDKLYNFDDSLIVQRLLMLEQNDISDISKEKQKEIMSDLDNKIWVKDGDSTTISIWFYEKQSNRVLVREDWYDKNDFFYYNYYIYNIESKKLNKLDLKDKSWDKNDNLYRLIHIINLSE